MALRNSCAWFWRSDISLQVKREFLQLAEKLGEGAFGKVYKGLLLTPPDYNTTTTVAVKEISGRCEGPGSGVGELWVGLPKEIRPFILYLLQNSQLLILVPPSLK